MKLNANGTFREKMAVNRDGFMAELRWRLARAKARGQPLAEAITERLPNHEDPAGYAAWVAGNQTEGRECQSLH